MREFVSLKVLDRFRTLFERLGVDYPLMRKILQIKLTMDGRRMPTIFNQSAKKNGHETGDQNNFVKSLGLYALMGLIMVPFVVMGDNYMFQMSFLFGVLMFLVMTSLISDFSTVLLDIRDRNIIASKPVNRRTIGMAKTLHILLYLFFLTAALCAAPMIAALVKHGVLFFLLFVVEIVLTDVLIVVVTAFLYMLILKFFDGEKLKDMINNVQIILSIAITVGYQFVGRSFDLMQLHVAFEPKWWQALIPPLWFGASFEWLLRGQAAPHFIVFTLLAFVTPIVSILIYTRLVPFFERSLHKLANDSAKKGREHGRWLDVVSRFICSGREERTFFRFSSLMMGNEREFKLKVYPSLGFSIVFPFIFFFNVLRNQSFVEIAASKWYLNIYFCALLIPTVVMMLRYSGKPKGAWLYKTMPLSSPAPIFRGTIKAFLVRLFMPVYLIESVIFIALFGVRIVPDLIVVALSVLLYTVICFRTFRKALPFSESFEAVKQNDSLTFLPLLLLLALFAGVHLASTFVTGGVYAYMALLVVLNAVVWRKGFAISWDALRDKG
ncbi:hypothetical protein SAMN04487970_103025 [Paenibacillus tianmuensis]|uniref:ABC-2 type transport system permease protein n=1 Tax=Paenibacillus tianmuensis TaxID=624147 RepID=A0A1G4SKC2_9BACL|nr:hypothetical protein [Paenibacillus tianmuensis]SCW69610.1 hypothetical protein SAMN04487970_103025 [Paenibacillus tianmuensis]